MESLNNEEEFCWLRSSNGTEGSDDALKSAFKFSSAEASLLKSISDYNIDTNENMEGLPINDGNNKASPIDKKLRSRMNANHDDVPSSLSTFHESAMKSGNRDDLMAKLKVGYPSIFFSILIFKLDSELLNFKLCCYNSLWTLLPKHTHGDIHILTKLTPQRHITQ